MIAMALTLLIKSSLVAGLALSAVWLMSGRAPSERVVLLRAAVLLLVALPAIALAGPDLTIRLASAPVPAASSVAPLVALADEKAPAAAAAEVLPGLPAWLAIVWALGGGILLARFGLGVLTLIHWTRTGEVVSDPAWTTPLARLAGGAAPRLLASARIASPLSWGIPPGVVLIGTAHIQQSDDAEAVLAHELAHIRRRDWLFLTLARLATALFWFNPVVWLLQAELGRLSEEAADADALRHVEPEAYARTLLGMASSFVPVAATGMTGPARSLAKRITKIMTHRRPASPRPLAMMAAVGVLLAVATPLAAVELSVQEERVALLPPAPPAPPAPPLSPLAPPAPPAPPIPTDRIAPLAPPRVPAPPAPPVAPQAPQGVSFGGAHFYQSSRPLTDERRAAVTAARQSAAQARATAREGRAMAAHARTLARTNERLSHDAERSAARAQAMTEQAARVRARAEEARATSERRRAEAQVQMRAGADQMEAGAREMREEARRLRDPAYRAEQIERARERGRTVTDQQLLDAIPRMEAGAERMVAGAARMRARGTSPV